MYQLHWTFRMIQRNISDKPRITQLWYSRWSFFSWHETDGFVALWSFVQALLRHFLPKNGFIVGIQENSSSSNSPATQFTPESLNCDTVVGASFHDTRQTASLHCEALCRPCFDISFRKTVSLLAFKRILPALTLQQPNSPQNHSIVILSLELLFMTRDRRLRCILKLCAGPASTFPSEKRFHLWHSREFFQL